VAHTCNPFTKRSPDLPKVQILFTGHEHSEAAALPTGLTRSPRGAYRRRGHFGVGRVLVLDVMCISVNGRQPAHQVRAHAQPLQFLQILSIGEIMGSLTASAKLALPL
jgi:hypothetical protein